MGIPAPKRGYAFQDPYESDVHRARHATEYGDITDKYWAQIESQKGKDND